MASSLGYFFDYYGAVLAFVKGFTQPFDLWRVVQGNKQFWAFMQMAWTIVADVDIESEKFRWMGDARYTMGGVKGKERCSQKNTFVQFILGIMTLRKYHGKLHYLPSSDTVDLTKDRRRTLSNVGLSKEEEDNDEEEVEDSKKEEETKIETKEFGTPAFSGKYSQFIFLINQVLQLSFWTTYQIQFHPIGKQSKMNLFTSLHQILPI